MDGSRLRRTKDPHRQRWYARYRQWRFARHYGFVGSELPYPLLPRREARPMNGTV